ncbi:MAG: OmpA family protein [Thiobacillaceae bacterium]
MRGEASGTAPGSAPAGKTVIVHFAFDSAQLTAAGHATLDTWLTAEGKDAKVVIIGHADRLGPAAYNKALSRRRAEAVRAYLVSKGVDAGRIEIIAKGESQPVKHCKGGANPRTIACLAPNRRVEIDP